MYGVWKGMVLFRQRLHHRHQLGVILMLIIVIQKEVELQNRIPSIAILETDTRFR